MSIKAGCVVQNGRLTANSSMSTRASCRQWAFRFVYQVTVDNPLFFLVFKNCQYLSVLVSSEIHWKPLRPMVSFCLLLLIFMSVRNLHICAGLPVLRFHPFVANVANLITMSSFILYVCGQIILAFCFKFFHLVFSLETILMHLLTYNSKSSFDLIKAVVILRYRTWNIKQLYYKLDASISATKRNYLWMQDEFIRSKTVSLPVVIFWKVLADLLAFYKQRAAVR